MALTRLFFALLLVCCLSFAIEKPALWDQMNMKARQKWERAVSTGYKGKSTGPSARDKYWASMRSDDSHNNTVPTHRYVEAQNYFLSQPTKRYYNSPWTNIGPNSNNPVGGRTRAILVTPTGTLYAGCVSGGLWKSTNGGNSWTVLTDMMANIAVSTVAMDSSGSIYVGTGEGFNSADAKRGNGIFKSRNDVFSQLSVTSNSDFYYVNKIVISDKDEIYAATRTGLFRSIDSGASFSLLLKGNMMDAAIAKLNGNNVIMTWNSGYGLFSSVDGSTFKQVIGTSSQDNSMFRGSISVSPSLPSVVYISLSSNSGNMVNVYKSTDSGQSFTGKLLWDSSNAGKLNKALLSNPYYNFDTGNGMSCATSVKAGGYNQGWYNNAIAVHPLDPNTVFIGGVDLFKSNDGGRTFHLISTWWSTNSNYLHADQHTIIFSHNNSTVYIGNDGGVYKSENINIGYYDNPCSPPSQNIPSFTPLNSNYGTLQFYHGSVANSMLVGGTQDNGSWKYSSTWGVISGGDGGFTAIDGNNIYTSNTYTSISRHNSGNTTKMVGVGDLDGNGIFINPFVVYNSTVFTCAKSCWRRYGDKWERIGNAIGVDISALYVNKDMYVGGVSGGFWRLENGNWNKVGTNSLCNTCGEFYISSITVHPSISDRVFVTISSFGDPHLWQSNDRGNTWFSLSHNIPDVPVLDLLIASSSTFYLGTDLGVLYSEDNGTNWSWVNQYGLANVPVYKLGLSGNNVYAFSHGRGVYRTVMTTSGTGDWHGSTLSSTIWADGDGVGMESTKSETKSGKKLGMWIIVGISAGGGIFVVFIVVLSIVLVRRKNRKRSESQEQILSVPVGMANNAM